MPLTSGSSLVLKTAEQSFWNTFHAIPDPFEGLVFRRQSTQLTDTYARLGAAPMPTAWDGDRDAKAVPELTFTVTNQPYDSTVKIDKELVQFQQWDEVGTLTSNQGMKARAHQTSLLTTLLYAGTSTVGDDGQFFFDTDHADPGAAYTTSQDNDLTTDIVDEADPTDLEFAAALRACFNSVHGFKDSEGDPHVPQDDNPANFIVMVPAEYRAVARRVQMADSLSGPVANDLRGTFTTRFNPFMADATSSAFWFFYAGSTHKPTIVQESGSLRTQMEEDFHSGNFYYSASWWGAAAYGQWRSAVAYTFTTT